jgi:hypothetical protein
MKFITKFTENLKKQENWTIQTLLGVKAIGGMGLGILLTIYLPKVNWIIFGWSFLGISIIVGLSLFCYLAKHCIFRKNRK